MTQPYSPRQRTRIGLRKIACCGTKSITRMRNANLSTRSAGFPNSASGGAFFVRGGGWKRPDSGCSAAVREPDLAQAKELRRAPRKDEPHHWHRRPNQTFPPSSSVQILFLRSTTAEVLICRTVPSTPSKRFASADVFDHMSFGVGNN